VNTTATPGQATITATATGYNPAQVEVEVAEPSGYPTQIRLTAIPTNPVAQPAFTGTLLVELTDQEGDPAQAPTNTSVSLSSSSPQVAGAQPQAVIPAGEAFAVAHYNTSLRVGAAVITATATGYTAGSTQVEVSGPQPYSVQAALAPTTPAPGEPVTLTVWLTDQEGDPAWTPVPVSVAVTSSNTTMLNPPATVVIPAGTYYTQVEFKAGEAGARGEQVMITTASTGLQPATLQTTVENPGNSGGGAAAGAPTLVVETQPGSLIADSAAGERVLLVELETGNTPMYPTEGLNITLRSSNPDVVWVPQSVTLPPNHRIHTCGGEHNISAGECGGNRGRTQHPAGPGNHNHVWVHTHRYRGGGAGYTPPHRRAQRVCARRELHLLIDRRPRDDGYSPPKRPGQPLFIQPRRGAGTPHGDHTRRGRVHTNTRKHHQHCWERADNHHDGGVRLSHGAGTDGAARGDRAHTQHHPTHSVHPTQHTPAGCSGASCTRSHRAILRPG